MSDFTFFEQIARNLGLPLETVVRGYNLIGQKLFLDDPEIESAVDEFLLTRDLAKLRELVLSMAGSDE